MDRNALAELLQALESRRDAEERRREERYTALIEREVNSSGQNADKNGNSATEMVKLRQSFSVSQDCYGGSYDRMAT
ncbi:UNVERIFIED_CONTAM: hypothetical protein FKN15_009470 [Acipenser sinensis]